MSPVDQNRQYRWQESGKAAYAPRFEQKEWEKHEEDIKSLHAGGRTKKEILRELEVQHGFRPSYGQLRKRLCRWTTTTSPHVSPSQLSPPSQHLFGTPDSGLSDLDAQRKKTEPALTKDEEHVFKMFTSILDDAHETSDTNTEAPKSSFKAFKDKFHLKSNRSHPQHKPTTSFLDAATGRIQTKTSDPLSTSLKEPNTSNTKSLQRKEITSSYAKNATSLDKQRAASTTALISTTPRILTLPSSPIAVDSPSDDQPTGSGPLLSDRSSASPDSRDFEELSIQSYRLSRKRKRYYDGLDLDSSVSRTVKKTRHRHRYACCGCGKTAHSYCCENCGKKR